MLRILHCGVAILLFTLLSAQDFDSKDSLESQLVITHSKVYTPLKKSYKPMLIISREEILEFGQDDISRLLDRQLGITVAGANSNFGKDKSLFVQGASGEYSLILMDGMPVTDPSGIGGSFDLRNVSLEQVERIEILKGGQSTLYGSDAIASVINIITVPGSSAQNASVTANYGSFNTLELGSAFAVGNDQFTWSIDGSYKRSDGISEALDESGSGFVNDPSSRSAINSMISWMPSQNLSVKPYLKTSRFKGDFDDGAYTDGVNSYESDWINYGLISDLSYEKAEFRLSFSNNRTDRIFNSAAFGESEFNGRFKNIEAYSNLTFSSKVSLGIGVNIQSHKMIDANASIVDPSVLITSPFVALNVTLSDQTTSEFGLRLNDHETFGTNVNYSVGISHWLSDNIKAHGFISTSFKAPNLFQLFGQFGANPNLDPQTGRSMNAGLSLQDIGLFDIVSMDVFQRRVRNLIAFSFSDGYLNQNRQEDFGIEIHLKKDVEKFRWSMGYTYLFGELVDDSLASDPIENLIRRPRHQIKTDASYKINRNFQLTSFLSYTGQRDDLFFNTSTFVNEALVLDAFWLLDLQLSHRFLDGRLQMKAVLNNVFDSDYQEIAGFSTLGRNFTLGVHFDIL